MDDVFIWYRSSCSGRSSFSSMMTQVPVKCAFFPSFLGASIMGHSLFRIALSSAVKSSANLNLLYLRYSLFFAVLYRRSLVDLVVKQIIVALGLFCDPWYLPRQWTISMSSVIFCCESGNTAQQMLITLVLISSGLPSGMP